MACIEDRRQKYGRELAAQRHLQACIRARLGNSAPPDAPGGGGDEPPLPGDPDTLAARLSESEAEAARCVAPCTTAGPVCFAKMCCCSAGTAPQDLAEDATWKEHLPSAALLQAGSAAGDGGGAAGAVAR
jgi:hypothetical protein